MPPLAAFLVLGVKNMKLIHFDTVESTNSEAKILAANGAEEFTAVFSEHQSAGRGRLGRSFYSPRGSGLYLSVVLRPRLSASDALSITTAAAVAVSRAIENFFHKSPKIKWVNDLYLNDKKICGILCESALNQEGGAEWVILGIGINLFPSEEPIPEELRDIVGFVCEEKTDVDKAYIAAEIIKEFKKIYDRIEEREFFKEYNERLMLTGRRVTVLAGGTEKSALVLGTDNNLGLRVLFDDKTESTLTAGEVSIKL